MITTERKKELINEFAQGDGDTGSTPVQIALVTERIQNIAKHLKAFPQDKHSRLGLLKLVGRKRRLERYLKRNDHEKYTHVMKRIKEIL